MGNVEIPTLFFVTKQIDFTSSGLQLIMPPELFETPSNHPTFIHPGDASEDQPPAAKRVPSSLRATALIDN